jgi:hypothetical protein
MKKISRREKNFMVMAFCGAIIFAGYLFVFTPLEQYYNRIKSQTPKMRIDLKTAQRLRKQYETLDEEVKVIRERLDARQDEFNPYDFLDTLARKEGIRSNLDKITSATEAVNEKYHEDIVKIRLKNVALSKLVRYLYNIENSGQLLTVKELTIKPDRRNSMVLDANFEVSTFSRTEKEAD